MFIGIRELGRHELRFREDFQPGMVDFRSAEYRQVGPLRVEVEAELDGEEIHLSGRLRGKFEISCARCLALVSREVERDFDLHYRPLGRIRKADELKLSPGDLDIGFYRGDGLFLADALAEQVNLEMPVKALCSEECRGLCSRCGVNLNRETCRCQVREPDPRWGDLARWRVGEAGESKS